MKKTDEEIQEMINKVVYMDIDDPKRKPLLDELADAIEKREITLYDLGFRGGIHYQNG